MSVILKFRGYILLSFIIFFTSLAVRKPLAFWSAITMFTSVHTFLLSSGLLNEIIATKTYTKSMTSSISSISFLYFGRISIQPASEPLP